MGPDDASGKRVEVGDPAPDFALSDQTGRTVRLSDYVGRGCVVLFFYPKDNTPGCTAESCHFRDRYEEFNKVGAMVVGISSDTGESHRRFADRYHLPFTLVSDEGGRVRRRYGVPSTLGVLPGRVTYVIDKEGIVRHIFKSQFRPHAHVKDALEALHEMACGRQ